VTIFYLHIVPNGTSSTAFSFDRERRVGRKIEDSSTVQ
jgi:hypothetical protein